MHTVWQFRTARILGMGLAVGTALLFGRPLIAQDVPPPGPAAAGEDLDLAGAEDTEFLLRGPLHEAFAVPVSATPEAGIVIPREPPEPLDEVPPEIKPEGAVVWIPGYWAWDDERENFLWISGLWRVPPPNRRWVPGYWASVEGGFQWTAGFWAPLAAEELVYLPEPPATVEQGPSSPAPSDDHFWVNGTWSYQDGNYAWRPGFWATGYPNWVWMPSHYIWTPHGCLFIRGYWDYQLARRGMCFAPAYFRSPIYTRPGYCFRPQQVISLATLPLHLFVRSRYTHYYFGDWYGPYDRLGIVPVYSYYQRVGYDPIWTYYRWYSARQGVDYVGRMRQWHRYFEQHPDCRPRHTWREQQEFVSRQRDFRHLSEVTLARNVEQVVNDRTVHVERVNDVYRDRVREASRAMRDLVDTRRRVGPEVNVEGAAGARGGRRLLLPETADVQQVRLVLQERASRNGDQEPGGRGSAGGERMNRSPDPLEGADTSPGAERRRPDRDDRGDQDGRRDRDDNRRRDRDEDRPGDQVERTGDRPGRLGDPATAQEGARPAADTVPGNQLPGGRSPDATPADTANTPGSRRERDDQIGAQAGRGQDADRDDTPRRRSDDIPGAGPDRIPELPDGRRDVVPGDQRGRTEGRDRINRTPGIVPERTVPGTTGRDRGDRADRRDGRRGGDGPVIPGVSEATGRRLPRDSVDDRTPTVAPRPEPTPQPEVRLRPNVSEPGRTGNDAPGRPGESRPTFDPRAAGPDIGRSPVTPDARRSTGGQGVPGGTRPRMSTSGPPADRTTGRPAERPSLPDLGRGGIGAGAESRVRPGSVDRGREITAGPGRSRASASDRSSDRGRDRSNDSGGNRSRGRGRDRDD